MEIEHKGRTLALDTGFVVYNEVTYPNLVRLFDRLAVKTQTSDMSFGLRCARCDLEYSGSSLMGLLAQPINVLRPSFLRMLADVMRFNSAGRLLIQEGRDPGMTLGEFVLAEGYSPEFVRHYLAPMAAAIWSSGTGDIHRFPIFALLRFFSNHGLLGVTSHLPWRTVTGGSQTYVRALQLELGERLHTDMPVVRVERDGQGVRLHFADDTIGSFDAVVMAAHADEALALLAEPTDDERELLGAWRYSTNQAVLHTDTGLLPATPRHGRPGPTWCGTAHSPPRTFSVSYYLNKLQSLDIETTSL